MPLKAVCANGTVIDLNSNFTCIARNELILKGPFTCCEAACGGQVVVCGGRDNGKRLHFRHVCLCTETNYTTLRESPTTAGGESEQHMISKQWVCVNIKTMEIVTAKCITCGTLRIRTFRDCEACCEGHVKGLPFRFDVLINHPSGQWQAIEIVHSNPVSATKLRMVHNEYPFQDNNSRILQLSTDEFRWDKGAVTGPFRINEMYRSIVNCNACSSSRVTKRQRETNENMDELALGYEGTDSENLPNMDIPLLMVAGPDPDERQNALHFSELIINQVIAQAHTTVPVEGMVIKVTAIAGAGKTWLLKRFVESLGENNRALVISFNKALQDDWTSDIHRLGLSQNVYARTFDSLLVGELRENFNIRMKCIIGKHKVDRRDGNCNWCSYNISRGLENFCKTTDELPGHQHCDTKFINRTTLAAVVDKSMQEQWQHLKARIHNGRKEPCAIMARFFYENRDLFDPKISNYTFIIIDEVQDMTPVEAALFAQKIPGKTTLVVGDPLQCINQFRGADVHTMEKIEADMVRTIPCTYRYGFPLNKFVQKAVRGLGSLHGASYVSFTAFSGVLGETTVTQVADLNMAIKRLTCHDAEGELHCIYRHNMSIVFELMELIRHPLPINISVSGRIKSIITDGFLRDLCRLKTKRWQHVDNKAFDRRYLFDDGFSAYQKNVYQKDKQAMCTFAELHAEQFLRMYGQIVQKIGTHIDGAPCINFCTAHGAKGATYDHVYIGKGYAATEREEVNILYVALTRASRTCCICDETFALAFE